MKYLLDNKPIRFKKYRLYVGFFILFLPLFYLLDPSDSSWGMNKIVVLKYLPILVIMMWLGISPFLGIKINFDFSTICIFILFLMMCSGGLYTLTQHGNIKESFLGRSLSILAFFWGSFFWLKERDRTIINFGKFLIYVSFVMGAMLILWQMGVRFVNRPHIFHEEVFVFYASFIASYYIFKNRYFIYFNFFFCILCAVLTLKNTGFLVAFLMILHCFYIRYREFNLLLIKRILFFSLILLIAVLVYWFLSNFSSLLPSGSPEVRLKTYQMRLDMFIENMWFGSFFRGSPLLELKTFYGSIVIPSHSDVIDILAFGGILSFLLCFLPFLILLYRFFNTSALKGISKNILYCYDFSISIVVSLTVIMMVNPILNQPKIAIFYWFFLGLGLSCNKTVNHHTLNRLKH